MHLPDDLEARWEAADHLQRCEWLDYWRDNATKMTWQQRRRVRALIGNQPITPCGGGDANAESIAGQEQARTDRIRRIRKYGKDGEAVIEDLAHRLLVVRKNMPAEQAYRWAEQKFEREQVDY